MCGGFLAQVIQINPATVTGVQRMHQGGLYNFLDLPVLDQPY